MCNGANKITGTCIEEYLEYLREEPEGSGQWYHKTEDEALVGPFSSQQLAVDALIRYFQYLG